MEPPPRPKGDGVSDEPSSGEDSGCAPILAQDSEPGGEDLGDLSVLEHALRKTARGSRESEDERRIRLEADAQIVKVLRQYDFTGPLYERLVERLMLYGWRVLLQMMHDGSVFGRCGAVGRPVPKDMIAPDWTAEDKEALATDSLIEGLKLFRRLGLVEGRWQPEQGATLATYYVGAVLRCFSGCYKGWYRSRRQRQGELASASDPRLLEAYLASIPDPRAADPAARCAQRAEIRRTLPLLPALLRWAASMAAEGYTQSEIAEKAGLSQKALENRWRRARHKLPRHRREER